MATLMLNLLLRLKMELIRHGLHKPLLRKTHHPQATQEKLLMQILDKNKDTALGKEYGFSDIKSYADFSKKVPIQRYEDLRPYIEKQEQEKKPYLNPSQPVLYAQTSGTTGKPKYIPILKSTLRQYRHNQALTTYAIYQAIPHVFDGKLLVIGSPAIEGHLDTGTPYGSMSGVLYQRMPRLVHAKYVIPSRVFDIHDYELKYELIAAFALAEKDITLIATANPSTLLKIHEVITVKFDKLLRDIESGNQYGLPASPARAEELKIRVAGKRNITFPDLWPNLKAVGVWMGGNCAVLIPSLRKLLARSTKVFEVGYLSSEFCGSLPLDVQNNQAIPAFHEHFLEFAERDTWESGKPDFVTLEKLEEGKQYYIFVTTQNGLYRYDIHDIIEMSGRINQTPTIRFIQKGVGITNLTGEKLYESQIVEAVQELKEELSVEFDFFMMIGCPREVRYTFYIEAEPFDASMETLEKHLNSTNIEFEAKRKSGRLKETGIVFLKNGVAEAYKKHCLRQGQREGQFKPMHLQYSEKCSFDFAQYKR